jgi:hypothetical protein
VRSRSAVTAKCLVCLAVVAAGDWLTSAVALFVLLRVLGEWWGGPELAVRARQPEYRSVRVVLWLRRFEVGAAVTVVTARTVVSHLAGPGVADDLLLVGVAVVLGVPAWRDRLAGHLISVRRRRRWANTLGAVIAEPGTPRVSATGTTSGSEWAQVRIGPGSTVEDLAGQVTAIAACLAVETVRVEGHPSNAGWATVTALRTDPLSRPAPPWPWAQAARTSLWEPVPVGIDEAGRSVNVSLAEHNLLLGGEPGAGKSVALSQLVAAAALDPTAGLWLLDGKLVELAPWRPAADGWAGVDIADAIAVLREVQDVMDSRYRDLLDRGRRKISPGSRLEVVVIDELAHYLAWGDKKPRDVFTDLLRDLVSRGRAAGVVVIAATQKPSSDVVPTILRDLFGYRWALRCTTNAASDTILGSGWAAQGSTAASIAPAARGVGWLLHESGLPQRLRAHHLDDPAIGAIAARAATLRAATVSRPTPGDDGG